MPEPGADRFAPRLFQRVEHFTCGRQARRQRRVRRGLVVAQTQRHRIGFSAHAADDTRIEPAVRTRQVKSAVLHDRVAGTELDVQSIPFRNGARGRRRVQTKRF